jgi:hypothetical protein
MVHEVDVKSELCTVRLTERQVAALDEVAGAELSRSQLMRILVEDFARKPTVERRQIVTRQLFRGDQVT